MYQNKVEERGLVDFDEVGVENLKFVIGGGYLVLGLGGSGSGSSVDVPFAVLDDLGEDFTGDVGDRNDVVDAVVLDHVLYRLRLNGDGLVNLENLAIGAS